MKEEWLAHPWDRQCPAWGNLFARGIWSMGGLQVRGLGTPTSEVGLAVPRGVLVRVTCTGLTLV